MSGSKEGGTMNNLEQLLRELRTDIKKDSEESLKTLETRIIENINKNIDKKFNKIYGELEEIKESNMKLDKRILEIEKHIRRKNIIFFGVEEGEKSYDELEKKILHIITQDMHVECSNSEIEIVRRMGKPSANKIRPIVATFITLGKKINILMNKRHLNNKSIYIKVDYPKQVLEERKKLQEQAQMYRKEGNNAYIRNGQLVIQSQNTEAKNLNEKENNSKSKKRNLEVTPPHQQGNRLTKNPSVEYQPNKRNKGKAAIKCTAQSSMTSFFQKQNTESNSPQINITNSATDESDQ